MPLSPSSTRELLGLLGHEPKRFLGQNFLVDGNIVRKSLELAGVQAGDAVVEVGPGLGTLTGALLAAGAEVWAVEKDRNLHLHLEESLLPSSQGRLHLLEGDAVEQPLAGIPAERALAGFKVVANLPYAISTPWMDAVLSGPLPSRMVLMLQQEAPEDFVIATGRQESVRRFIELAAHQLGWGAMAWEGEGAAEIGRRADTGAVVVRIDPRYFRPAEVDTLLGDPSKAREKLGWTPSTTLEELVAEMVAADREEAAKEATLRREGFSVVVSHE